MTEIVTYPHRQFFGTGDNNCQSGAFRVSNNLHWLRGSHHTDGLGHSEGGLYGIVPIDEFLALGKPASQRDDYSIIYQPNGSDTSRVKGILCEMGLPVELALDIMELAGYEPKRRLKIEHDPLHLENREELAQYLRYCWQILIRCDMTASEVDLDIPWYDEVAGCIVDLIDSIDCKLRNKWLKLPRSDCWNSTPY
jgi:hypothetical protein